MTDDRVVLFVMIRTSSLPSSHVRRPRDPPTDDLLDRCVLQVLAALVAPICLRCEKIYLRRLLTTMHYFGRWEGSMLDLLIPLPYRRSVISPWFVGHNPQFTPSKTPRIKYWLIYLYVCMAFTLFYSISAMPAAWWAEYGRGDA